MGRGHQGQGHGILWTIGFGGALFGLFAMVACGPGEAPTPTPTATSVAKVATPSPTATAVPTPTPGPKRGGILNRFNFTDTKKGTMDPNVETSARDVLLVSSNFNQLLRYDPATSGLVPDLAKSWKISADGKSIAFTLRDDAKFTDGTPVTPEDVVYSLRRIVGELGASATNTRIGPSLKQVWSGAEVTGANEVTVKTTAPSSMFLGQLGSAWVKIVPKHVLDATEKKTFTTGATPVGAGPFKLTKWQRDVVVEQERYQGYVTSFGEGLPYLDGMRTYIIKDSSAQIAAIEGGQVDLWPRYQTLDASQGKAVKSFLGDKVIVGQYPEAGFMVLHLNTKRPVFQDPRVIKAMWVAMDRKGLNNVVFEGSLIIGAIVDPDVFQDAALPLSEVYSYPGIKEPDYALAKKLLADAGYPDGVELEMIIQNSGWVQDASQVLIAGFAKAGIRVKPAVVDVAAAQARLDARLFDLGYVFVGGFDTPQPLEPFLASWMTGASRNHSESSDPKLDQMIKDAAATLDPKQRNRSIQDIQRYLYSNMSNGTVPLGVPKDILAQRTYVKGYVPSLTYVDGAMFDTTWLDR